MRIYPLSVMALMLLLCAVLARFSPVPYEAVLPVRILCGLLVAAGLFLLAAAAAMFGRRGTTVNPVKTPRVLVSRGIFRVTRNPMYLGMLMILTGFPFLVGFPPGLLFPALFFLLLDRHVIPAEEKAAERVFGDAWRAYASRTRRWL